jgi:hypothetical protein
MGGQVIRVTLKFGQVVEGIRSTQLAGVDQAHKQVPDVRATTGLVEQGVLAVQDGTLQRPLAHVVIQRRAGYAQE